MVIAKSMFPLKLKYPTLPAYIPLLDGSSSSIISMALTFGAPVTVPAGNDASNASKEFRPSFNSPFTFEIMCCTWEYFSIPKNSVTLTLPNLETLPMSFRPRSTSITCSALSFSSFSISLPKDSSSTMSEPLGRVPAIGLIVTVSSSTFTSISGLEPIICLLPKSNRYI